MEKVVFNYDYKYTYHAGGDFINRIQIELSHTKRRNIQNTFQIKLLLFFRRQILTIGKLRLQIEGW